MPLQLTSVGLETRNQAEILAELRLSIQTATLDDGTTPAFGPNFNTEPDSYAGQFLNILAENLAQTDQVLAQLYASIGPGAEGLTLDGLMRLAGLERNAAVRSSVDVILTADVFGGNVPKDTVFAVNDSGAARFVTLSDVVLPAAGTAQVACIAQEEGAVIAAVNTLTTIVTPVAGLASVTNPVAAAVGVAVEADDQLLARHEDSLAIVGMRALDAVIAAVENVDGVIACAGYQNVTSATDAEGLESKAIELVVDGGADALVAAAIATVKSDGIKAQGTTVVTVNGEPVGLTRPTNKEVYYVCACTPAASGSEITAIKNALIAFLQTLKAGATLPQFKALAIVAGVVPLKTGISLTQGFLIGLGDQSEATLQCLRVQKPHTLVGNITVS